MTNLSKRPEAKKILTLGAFALLAAGCGSSGTNGSVAQTNAPITGGYAYPGVVQCPAGQINFGGGCYPASEPANACYLSGGSLIGNGSICRITTTLSTGALSYTGSMLRLFPSNPAGGLTVVGVYPGDRVTFTVNDARWGEKGGFLNLSCDEKVDGAGRDLTTGTLLAANEGYPQGLLVNNGAETYVLGAAGSVKPVQFGSGGALRIGFNVPYGTGSCYKLNVKAQIERCTNTAGAIVACP